MSTPADANEVARAYRTLAVQQPAVNAGSYTSGFTDLVP